MGEQPLKTTTTAMVDYFPILAWVGLATSFTQNVGDSADSLWLLLFQAALLVLFAGWSVNKTLEYGKGRENIALIFVLLTVCVGMLAFWQSQWARLAAVVLVIAYVILSRKINRRPWEEPTHQ
ncbi:hypothetical protein ACFPGO_07565 [Arcanobacterium canis]